MAVVPDAPCYQGHAGKSFGRWRNCSPTAGPTPGTGGEKER